MPAVTVRESNYNSVDNGTSFQIFASLVPSKRVFLFVTQNGTGSISVSGLGATWTKQWSPTFPTGNGGFEMWTGVNGTSNGLITISSSVATHAVACYLDFGNLATYWNWWQGGSSQGSGTTMTTTGTGPGVQNGAAWVSIFMQRGGAVFTPPGGSWATRCNVRCIGGAGATHSTLCVATQLTTSGGSCPVASATSDTAYEYLAISLLFEGMDTVAATSWPVAAQAAVANASYTVRTILRSTVAAQASVAAAKTRTRASLLPTLAIADVQGSAAVSPYPLVMFSVDAAAYGGGGGSKLVITGRFPKGEPITVYVGPTGTDADPQTHSGKPGRRAAVSYDGSTLVTYLPEMAPGTYSLYAVAGAYHTRLLNAVTVVPANFASGAFGLRALFSPIFRVGSRNLDEVP